MGQRNSLPHLKTLEAFGLWSLERRLNAHLLTLHPLPRTIKSSKFPCVNLSLRNVPLLGQGP